MKFLKNVLVKLNLFESLNIKADVDNKTFINEKKIVEFREFYFGDELMTSKKEYFGTLLIIQMQLEKY
ncbi:MAG: hypothetical protein ACJARX_001712 [Psychroserpens sp.]|jgi:hypothetical protein|uniref:hypothetical protein n=1 Tax=Psychroserpens sp. TaxID=2020870 RepID=UPI0039E56929